MFKSTDGGASWNQSNGGITQMEMESLVIDPGDAQTLYAGSASGVFKTTNGGAAWAASSTGLVSGFIKDLAIDPQQPDTLYAVDGSAIFKSIDSGALWTDLNFDQGYFPEMIVVDPSNSDRLIVGTRGYGIYESTDGGQSWMVVNVALSENSLQVFDIIVSPSDPAVVYAGSFIGFYRSLDLQSFVPLAIK